MGTALVAFCALVISAPQAKADIQAIRNSDSEVWGSAGMSLFNYAEQIYAPNIPDSEHGWTPTIDAGVDYMTNSNWYYAFEGGVSFGSDHYNGSIFDFNTNHYDIPFQGSTNETIGNVDGKVGHGFALGSMVMLTPYGELGYRYWDRSLGAGQDETYHNFDMLGGLMLQVAPTSRLILTGYGSAGTTFGGNMHAQATGDTYDLGNFAMYKFGGKVGFDLTKRWEIFTALDYDAFRYMKSPTVFNTNFSSFEPSSKTEDTTLRVGLGYHFR